MHDHKDHDHTAHDHSAHGHGEHGDGEHDHGAQGHKGHSHHGHSHLSMDSGDWRISFAVGVNLALTFAQVAGGLIAGSIALIADGVHNFSDAFALILAFGARRIARRGATADWAFGWARIEVIAAFVNYVSLIVVALWLAVEALGRLVDPPSVAGWPVVWLATLALLIDLATAWLTYSLSKDSLNIRAAFLHNLADAGASVAVILGGVVILLFDWRLVDPLITLGISAFILWHIAGDLGPVFRILMLSAPRDIAAAEVEARLKQEQGVEDVHGVKLWQIDEKRAALQAHLIVAQGADFARITRACKAMLSARFGLSDVVLEVETSASGCADHAR